MYYSASITDFILLRNSFLFYGICQLRPLAKQSKQYQMVNILCLFKSLDAENFDFNNTKRRPGYLTIPVLICDGYN